MQQPKPKKVGRPRLAKGEAKGQVVPVRFKAEDIKKITLAAKKNNQTVSEWIRSVAAVALGGTQA